MAEHVIPNMNPNLMLGIWIEQTEMDTEPSDIEVHPIIGFVVSTTTREDNPATFDNASGEMVSVLSPACPEGMPLNHEQFRFYDKASGRVYNQIGDTDSRATEYMRDNASG